MDNRYNYYDPNQEDDDNIFDEQPRRREPELNYGFETKTSKRPKRKIPKIVSTIGLALVFGVVASIAFKGSNMLFDTIFGKNVRP